MTLRRLALVMLFCCVTVAFAHADSLQLVLGPSCTNADNKQVCSGYQFTTTVTQNGAGDFTVAFTVQNVSGQTAYLQGFSLGLFSGSIKDATVTSTNPAVGMNWVVNPAENSKYNNGNSTCGNATHPGTTCVEVSNAGNGYELKPGDYITFYLHITAKDPATFKLLNSWDIMASGTKYADGTGGNIFALSNNGTPVDVPVVPEPASMMLFGTGLLAVGAIRRRLR